MTSEQFRGAFGGAATQTGTPDTLGNITESVLVGKNVDPLAFAEQLKREMANGVFNPINMLVRVGAIDTRNFMPGGRPLKDIPEELKEGKQYQEPFDHSAPVSPAR